MTLTRSHPAARHALACAAALTFLTCGPAARSAPAQTVPDRAAAEAQLLDMERAKWQVGPPDVAMWERVLADDFVAVEYGPGGLRRASRADVLEQLRSGGLAMRENTVDELRVAFASDEIALVTYRLALDVPLGTFRAIATSGWAYRDGEWRTVFHQITEEPSSRSLWVGAIAGFFVSVVMLGLIRRLWRRDGRAAPPPG